MIQKSLQAWLSIGLVSEFWTLPKYWPSTQLPNKRLVIENLVHISLTKPLLFCPVRGAENLPNWAPPYYDRVYILKVDHREYTYREARVP